MLTGSICVIEMYVPFAVLPYQQFASLVSGLLLIALFAGLSTFGETRLPDQFIVVVPVLLVLFVAMPLGSFRNVLFQTLFHPDDAFWCGGGLPQRLSDDAEAPHRTFDHRVLGADAVRFSAWSPDRLSLPLSWSKHELLPYPTVFYFGLTLGALLVLLVAFLAMIVFSQQKAALPASEHAANRHEDLSVSGRGGRVDSVAKRYGLTAREKDVLALLDSGYSRQRIAEGGGCPSRRSKRI